MCVVIAKPQGIPLPKEKELRNCWLRNKDGAGVAWASGGKVYIRKGFMELEDLLGFLFAKDWQPYAMLIHFRAATHGGVTPHHCHPFPLSTSKDKLMQTKLRCNVAIAHNGIFSGYGEKNGLSDTQEFIQKVLAPLAKYLRREPIKNLIAEAARYNKLAFLFGDGTIHLYGDFKKHNNCYFSNGSYEGWTGYYYDYEWPINYQSPSKQEKTSTVTDECCDWCGKSIINGVQKSGPKFSYIFCRNCYYNTILPKQKWWGNCSFCRKQHFLYELYRGEYVCLDCLIEMGNIE